MYRRIQVLQNNTVHTYTPFYGWYVKIHLLNYVQNMTEENSRKRFQFRNVLGFFLSDPSRIVHLIIVKSGYMNPKGNLFLDGYTIFK